MPTKSVTLRVLGDPKGAIAALELVDKKADEVTGKPRLIKIGIDPASAAAANAALDELSKKADGIEARMKLIGSTRVRPNVDTSGLTAANTKIADTVAKLKALGTVTSRPKVITTFEARDVLLGAGGGGKGGGKGGGGVLIVPEGDGGNGRGRDQVHGTAPFFAGGLSSLGKNIPLFGGGLPGILGAISALHLVIDSIIEIGAVVIPASIALGAFGLAGTQAAIDIYNHTKDAETAITALGGKLPALSGGFAKVQAAVKPQVLTLFGEGLSLIGSKTGQFQTLATGAGNALIQFVNRGVTAFENSGLTGFAQKAVDDLNLLFHVIGNIGGIIGNVLRGVPGIAETLFHVLDNATGALERFTASPIVQGIERVSLGLHGAVVWGGLAASGFLRLVPVAGSLASRLAGVAKDTTNLSKLGDNAAFFDKIKAGAADLGNALPILGQRLGIVAKDSEEVSAGGSRLSGLLTKLGKLAGSPWTWATAGVAILAGLAVVIAGLHTKTEQWIASLQQASDNASVFSMFGQAEQFVIKTSDALSTSTQNVTRNVKSMASEFGGSAAANIAALKQKQGDLSNAVGVSSKQFGRLNTLFDVLDTKYGMNQKQVEALTVKMTGSKKSASELFDEYKHGQLTLSQLVNEYKSYFLATTGMVPTTARAREAVHEMDVEASDDTKAINNLVAAEDAFIQTSTKFVGGAIQVEQIIGQMSKAAAKAHDNWTGLNAASLALQATFENQFMPQLIAVRDGLNQNHASAHEMAKVLATEMTPAVEEGALKNKAFRGQLVDVARTAGFDGVNSIKAFTQWIDRNKISAREAALIIQRLGGNIGNLHNKAVKITVSGTGHWAIQSGGGFKVGPPGQGLQHSASGMLVRQGTTAHADDVLAAVSKGELIVPAHMVKAGLVDHLRGMIPGFAAGGFVQSGDYGGIPSTWPTTEMNATIHNFEANLASFIKKKIKQQEQNFFLGMPGGVATPGLFTVARFLMAHGATRAAAAGIAGTVAGESGGNPESVGSGGFGLIGWTGNTIGLPPGYHGPTGNVGRDMAIQLVGMLGYINANGGLGPLNRAGRRSPLAAADLFSIAYERPRVHYSDVRPSVVEQIYRRLRTGGILTEPTLGVGLHTGRMVTLAENGPEMVVPSGETMSHYGAACVYNISINCATGADVDRIGQELHQILRRYKKHRGNNPLGLE